MKKIINYLKHLFICHCTRSQWETVYAVNCKAHLVNMFHDTGKVACVASIQVERRKNWSRGRLTSGSISCSINITDIALGNPAAVPICAQEGITL